ncbi:ferredoxin III, nif-specific [Methylomonas sp. MED-D]|uniref:Ferredoxin III n=1 Tax=Methylomonas koyamae TaxID=702114 RepID=A0A177NK08_9GAMM|nr:MULTISPECIES: ferredoxin III, nif-specific [Methylomonas]NJA07638.1 ferredoxin III, nif-specific [Methylococcaceae bacterium WWC4]MDT4332593.1 ferredoxin III, nif-specific [Methylomonas sp. MV1]OAI17370.1 ferredoxin [Methylomonas koyamae]OHX34711.1 ferredoxin III, nif-specific [Methylomonas sp. LWB]WGS85248.1 ferredoxin III, nif-specific [Methylomonas sp. UP202]
MSEFVTGVTFGGSVWTPSYVTDLNQRDCIGCGRCFKVCPRDVFDLVDRGDVLDAADLEDFDEDDDNTMVMSLKNAADCIGCEACSKVCPKACFTHEHKAAA